MTHGFKCPEGVGLKLGGCCECQRTVPLVPAPDNLLNITSDNKTRSRLFKQIKGPFLCIPHTYHGMYCEGSNNEPQGVVVNDKF